MKRSLKLTALLFVFLMPFVVKAEENKEYEAITQKYYKTVTVIPNDLSLYSDNYIVSQTTEVTEEEYNSATKEMNTRGSTIATTETTYKKMTTTIAQNGNYYRYKVVLTWKLMPSTRSYDIIGIGFPSNVKVAATPGFNQHYCVTGGSCYTTGTYSPYTGTYGAGASFKVPSGTLDSMKQTFYVDVEKNNPNTTLTLQRAYGDYAHAQYSVTSSEAKNYYVETGGIVLDSSIDPDYDSINCAMSEWTGTW